MGLGVSALVTGAAVVTGAVLGTVVVAGATVVVLEAAVVELGTAGIRQGCQKPMIGERSLVSRETKAQNHSGLGQGTHLKSSSLEDVFCLCWHPAQR